MKMVSALKLGGRSTCADVINAVSMLEKNLIEEVKASTTIVTGANSGIGLKTAEEIMKLGGAVVLACRKVDAGEAAVAAIKKRNPEKEMVAVAMELELSNLKSVETFTRNVVTKIRANELPSLRVLVNNAGVFPFAKHITPSGLQDAFAICHLGHFHLTNQLLKEGKKSEEGSIFREDQLRVVNLSSAIHKKKKLTSNWTDQNELKAKVFGMKLEGHPEYKFDMFSSYASVKMCNVLHSMSLAFDVPEDEFGVKVTACSLHPGVVIGTNVARSMGPLLTVAKWFRPLYSKTIDQGSATSILGILLPDEMANAKYFDDCKEAQPDGLALKEEPRKVLWEASNQVISDIISNPAVKA